MVDSVQENNGSTNKPLCSVAVLPSSGLLDAFLGFLSLGFLGALLAGRLQTLAGVASLGFLGALLAGRLQTPAGVAVLAAGRLETSATLALEAMSA